MSNLIKNPILGAICGDMIGVPYEWYCRKGLQVNKDFRLWTDDSKFSDDSVMTIAVAEWLLDRPLNTNNLVKIMQKWGKRYPAAGYGGMFRKWLWEENPQPYNSFGNGSAMRVSPVGCAFKTEETTLTIAKESASVSHNHPEGIKGAKTIAWSIWYFLNEVANVNEQNTLELFKQTFKEKFCYFDYNINRTPEEIKKSGYRFDSTCQGSIPEAICCFLNSNSYEETVRNAVWLRGDADTQAAIAGSIAAAYWGIPDDIAYECLDRLPDDMYDILEKFSEMYILNS